MRSYNHVGHGESSKHSDRGSRPSAAELPMLKFVWLKLLHKVLIYEFALDKMRECRLNRCPTPPFLLIQINLTLRNCISNGGAQQHDPRLSNP
jgi:hypothetical protein